MADAKYNGWANYETWAVKLWLDNDEAGCALQQELLEQAENNLNPTVEASYRKETMRKLFLASLIERWVEENSPLADTTSMYSDLLGSAIDRVDWGEIAEHIWYQGCISPNGYNLKDCRNRPELRGLRKGIL